MPLVIFMRHGQADNNVNRILVGRYVESHLTDYGKEQITGTANLLKGIPITKIYSSPVIRTIETAEITSKILGMPYEIDERLYEIDLGKLVGWNYDEIISKYGNLFLRFYSQDTLLQTEYGVESFESVKKRVKSILDDILIKHSDGNILLITHLDPIKAVLSLLLDLKPEALYNWHMRNASLTILKHESSIFSLFGVNVIGMHRYMDE